MAKQYQKILAGLIAFLLITGATTYSWYKLAMAAQAVMFKLIMMVRKQQKKGMKITFGTVLATKKKSMKKVEKKKFQNLPLHIIFASKPI